MPCCFGILHVYLYKINISYKLYKLIYKTTNTYGLIKYCFQRLYNFGVIFMNCDCKKSTSRIAEYFKGKF